jgi:hypothetical protein
MALAAIGSFELTTIELGTYSGATIAPAAMETNPKGSAQLPTSPASIGTVTSRVAPSARNGARSRGVRAAFKAGRMRVHRRENFVFCGPSGTLDALLRRHAPPEGQGRRPISNRRSHSLSCDVRRDPSSSKFVRREWHQRAA